MRRHAWTQFEGDKTLEWRADCLADAGLDAELAAGVARTDVDLHWAVHVIKSGLANGRQAEVIVDLLLD